MFGIAAALAASIGYGSASVLEAMAARRACGRKIYTHPLYLSGLGLDALAWIASLIALQTLTLFTVQAMLAGSLAVTVLLARWAFATRVRVSALWAIALMVLGLVVVALSTGAQHPAAPPGWLTGTLVLVLVLLGLGVLAGYRRCSPTAMALAAGLAAGLAAVAARGLELSGRWWLLAVEPLFWVVLGGGVLTMLAYTRALETGPVGSMTAVFTVLEVVFPGLVGMVVFGDAPRQGWEAAKFIALAVSLGAGLWLAWQPGADPTRAAAQEPNAGKER